MWGVQKRPWGWRVQRQVRRAGHDAATEGAGGWAFQAERASLQTCQGRLCPAGATLGMEVQSGRGETSQGVASVFWGTFMGASLQSPRGLAPSASLPSFLQLPPPRPADRCVPHPRALPPVASSLCLLLPPHPPPLFLALFPTNFYSFFKTGMYIIFLQA